MIYNVYLRRAAERDVVEAQQWYEQQQAGLAAEFNAEFNASGKLPTTCRGRAECFARD